MKNTPRTTAALEQALRHGVPPLPPADAARVSRACLSLADAAPAPRHRPHFLAKPAIRAAAGLLFLASAALLIRPAARPGTPAAPLPPLTADAFLYPFGALADTQTFADLAVESGKLAADLADLTAILNEHTLSILF